MWAMSDPQLKSLPDDYLSNLNDDTSSLFVVWHLTRKGGVAFCTDLEETHYKPGTPRNALFELLVYQNFPPEPYWIARVPLSERALVEDVARKHGLRLQNGVPFVYEEPGSGVVMIAADRPHRIPKGARVFPLRSPRTFTLGANTPNDGVPVVEKCVVMNAKTGRTARDPLSEVLAAAAERTVRDIVNRERTDRAKRN